MKLAVTQFQGEAPITADRLLGPGMASSAVNAKLVSGDLDSFADFGNAFTLAKTAPIEALWLMQGPAPSYWLQFGEGEVAYGSGIDVALGTIPGDSTYRTFITGLAGGPRQTNLFYATDPSQRGGSAVGAYRFRWGWILRRSAQPPAPRARRQDRRRVTSSRRPLRSTRRGW